MFLLGEDGIIRLETIFGEQSLISEDFISQGGENLNVFSRSFYPSA